MAGDTVYITKARTRRGIAGIKNPPPNLVVLEPGQPVPDDKKRRARPVGN